LERAPIPYSHAKREAFSPILCRKLSETPLIFLRQIVGFEDADAFDEIRRRLGEGLVLFLTVMGMERSETIAVAEAKGL
jgi:hypothetical protein